MNPAQPSPIVSMFPVLAIFAVFYFLVIRPQQKQQKEHEEMLSTLKKGDRVLLNGGIYGVVVSLRGQDLELKIAENVKIVAARSAVSKLANPSGQLPAEQPTQVS